MEDRQPAATESSSRAESTSRHRGTCDCGDVSITLEGLPSLANACSCRRCQRHGTDPLGVGLFFPQGAIVSREGDTRIDSRTTDQGNHASRHFCPQCGSALYWFSGAVPGHAGVSRGAMEDPTSSRPSWLVGTRSLPPWIEIPGLRRFETQPE